MTVLDTLLVDGTDLSVVGARVIEDFDGVHAVAARRGSNYTLPARHGEKYTRKPLAALQFPVGLAILPVNPSTGVEEATEQLRIARMWANYRALVALVKAEVIDADATFTLTRVVSKVTGGAVYESCTAEVSGGIQTAVGRDQTMRVVVEFVNLDGLWIETAES